MHKNNKNIKFNSVKEEIVFLVD